MNNTMFKKITAALLVSIAILHTAACSNTNTQSSYDAESSVQSSAQNTAVSEISESHQSEVSTASQTESSQTSENSASSKTESEPSEPESSASASESSVSRNESSIPEENPQSSVNSDSESSVDRQNDPPVTEPSVKPEESSEPEIVPSVPPKESSGGEAAEVPAAWQDGGIFSRHYARAYGMVKNMTLEEKVGQMILARCPESNGSGIAKQYHLGGYILFGRDFGYTKTKDEVTGAIQSYTSVQKIPMIIAVDEEGGTVSRLQGNYNLIPHDFLSPRELYAQGGIDAIKNDAQEKSKILSGLLINTNLAPVCDISKNPNDFMYSRSIGQNPDITSDFVKAVTQISQQNGVSAALKHFPGYGNNADTHTGIAIDKRNYATFEANDFLPFKAGINAGAHMVLVSHNIVECMDKNYPASLSPEVHRILREELGFTGIVITDDLAMDAISVYVKGYSPVVAAVIAGNDMLCVSDIPGTYNDVLNAVHKGNIEEEQIDHAVMRILAWKMSKNML